MIGYAHIKVITSMLKIIEGENIFSINRTQLRKDLEETLLEVSESHGFLASIGKFDSQDGTIIIYFKFIDTEDKKSLMKLANLFLNMTFVKLYNDHQWMDMIDLSVLKDVYSSVKVSRDTISIDRWDEYEELRLDWSELNKYEYVWSELCRLKRLNGISDYAYYHRDQLYEYGQEITESEYWSYLEEEEYRKYLETSVIINGFVINRPYYITHGMSIKEACAPKIKLKKQDESEPELSMEIISNANPIFSIPIWMFEQKIYFEIVDNDEIPLIKRLLLDGYCFLNNEDHRLEKIRFTAMIGNMEILLLTSNEFHIDQTSVERDLKTILDNKIIYGMRITTKSFETIPLFVQLPENIIIPIWFVEECQKIMDAKISLEYLKKL